MKYQDNIQELQRILPTVSNIVIVLPQSPSVDHLAAGLALLLSFQQVQRQAVIVSEGPILVGHTNLFGVGAIQSKLPQASGGDYVLTLTGVADPSDPEHPIPSVEKMDYKTEGSDLKLIFKVVAGQRFEPQAVVPSFTGGALEVVFVIGSQTLEGLGAIYTQNQGSFNGAHIVNIDNQANNSGFGATNILDNTSSSLSEMIAQLIPALALPLEGDTATNVLSGISFVTNNFQSGNLSADTFLVVAEMLRAGGQRPSAPTTMPTDQAAIGQAFANAFAMPQSPADQQSDLNSFTGNGNPENPSESAPAQGDQTSPEEAPSGEGVSMEGEVVNPEPDWLTPKIFRGGGGAG